MPGRKGSLWDEVTDPGRTGAFRSWSDGGFVREPWREVLAKAHRAGADLRRSGIRPGVRVACVLDNSAASVVGLLGVWLAGGTIASLPQPSRGTDPGEYAAACAGIVAALETPLLLAAPDVLAALPGSVVARARTWASLGDGGRFEPSPPQDDDIAFIQFSSGSTGMPKGCLLTARAIEHQMRVIDAIFEAEPGDGLSSWLPLSHDMGMFGSLLYSLVRDLNLTLSNPRRFAMSPRTWFQDVVDSDSVHTVGTSTGLYLATRAHARRPLAGALALRTCVVGAERVDHLVLRRTVETFGANGLTPDLLSPAYGMSEATLAVTSVRPGVEPTWVHVDAARLADGEVVDAAPDDPRATAVMSCGPDLPGVTTSGVRPDSLGEIAVASSSLAEGYCCDAQRTRYRFRDGCFRSGDLGFRRDGELHLVGRADDVVCVAGRKVHALELEATVDRLDGLRQGRSVLVEYGGSGELVLLAETRGWVDDHRALAAAAAGAITAKAGVALSRCLFLERNSLPRTPSGKIQRFRSRMLLQNDQLNLVSTVDL